MDQTQPRLKRRQFTLSPVMKVLLGIFLVTAIVTIYLTFVTVREIARKWLSPDSVPQSELGDSISASGISLLGLDSPLQDEDGLTPVPWDGANRVTILLLGLTYREDEGGGAAPTDTIMVLTMDVATNTAGILSLPRDLWVNIADYGYGKINTAFLLGEMYNEPGGGPGLAVRTVENFLGVPINYYATIDFTAFVRIIDEIGGIEVNIPEDITVDPIGPGNTITLKAGSQMLDGEIALAYARNRDTGLGDIDRTQRQQQVIMAIRKRVVNLNMLPTLVKNASSIYDQVASGIQSNLSLQEIIQLAWFATKVPADNITRRVISFDHVTESFSPEGFYILIPDTDAIRQLRDEVFSENSSVRPAGPTEGVNSDPAELMKSELASISVLNATMIPGLASETTNYLLGKGMNITHTGNAQELSGSTIIIDYKGKPYTLEYLVGLLNIQESNIYSRYDPNSQVDIAIMLGDDWANSNPMP